MSKVIGLLMVSFLVLPFVASADEWKGTLVDTKCYGMSPSNVGDDHKMGAMKGCGAACARMGIPVALLVDGKLHVIAAPASSFADYIGKEASVSGDASGDIIMPKKVEVDGEEVNVGGMM